MKGGRKKSEATLQQQIIPNKGGEVEDKGGNPEIEEVPLVMEREEEFEEEEEEEYEQGDEEEDEEERPKLDEGFYEIEDVRRKRVRKGQLQYLIKWRGWPETANTWEPVENLQACSDIVQAFEDSLRSGKHKSSKSSRKRKRKIGGPQTQFKRKQNPIFNLPRDEPLPSTTLNDSILSHLPLFSRVETVEGMDHVDDELKLGSGNNVGTTEQPNGYGSKDQQSKANEVELNGIPNDGINAGNFSINFSDSGTLDKDGLVGGGLPKVECGEPVRSNRFTGAKKRKSGSVRRFKQDSTPCEPDQAHIAIARNTMESGDKFEAVGVNDAESMGDDADDRNKLDDSAYPSSITKIIKPIGYSASISNNVQDVSVTFEAMRSDGKEVVVDNKFLKVNNPLLLISFYEQHLRYCPPT